MKFVLSLLLVSSFASAALPPSAESLRRFRAVTESQELFQELEGRLTRKITDNQDGSFNVVAGDCLIVVEVQPELTEPPQMVPPLKTRVTQVSCSRDSSNH
jgi:hypothetical protein